MLCTSKARFADASKSIAEAIVNAKHVVVLSGAGISAESGIPTFRGAGGLWRNFQATELATREAFDDNPALVWQFYQFRRNVVEKCKPNPGHYAVARLEELLTTKAGKSAKFSLLTQNIDRLHQAAGSKHVCELHGSLWLVKPVGHHGFLEEADGRGKMKLTVWEDRTQPMCPALSPDKCTADAIKYETVRIADDDLPHVETSAIPVLLRPAVVWFGEGLDPRTMKVAEQALVDADVLIIIGTSGVVYPAAGFGDIVRTNGGTVIHINMDANAQGIDDRDMGMAGPSGECLPMIVAEVERLLTTAS